MSTSDAATRRIAATGIIIVDSGLYQEHAGGHKLVPAKAGSVKLQDFACKTLEVGLVGFSRQTLVKQIVTMLSS